MSRQTEIMELSYSNARKEYYFVLYEQSFGTLTLQYVPDGWDDGEISYIRSPLYHGVVRNLSTKELGFKKDGKQFIQNVYESIGIDAVILLYVYQIDNSTYDYSEYHVGKLDLTTYQITDVSVNVQMVDNSFTEKVNNREKSKVNLKNLVSIEGFTIPPFTVHSLELDIPDIDIRSYAEWVIGTPATGITDMIHNVPLKLDLAMSFPEAQTPSGTPKTQSASFLNLSFEDRTNIHITGQIKGNVIDGNGIEMGIEFWLYIIDENDVVQSSTKVGEKTQAGVTTMQFDVAVDETFNLLEDESACLVGLLVFPDNVSYTVVSLDAEDIYVTVNSQTVTAFPIYEAFLRTCQLICDAENPFYSEYFGRTDTPFTTYGSDGELAHITKGIYLRQATDETIPVMLKKLFEDVASIFPIGLGIEEVSGVWKVRIEDLDYWYDNTEVLDISDRANDNIITKEVDPDLYCNNIEVGFNKYDYEQTGGLSEFNTISNFTTVIESVSKTFKRICGMRADSQGLRRLLMADSVTANDDDVKGDEDIFIISSLRDGLNMIIKTDEGYTKVEGGISAGQSFNLDYSPARTLRKFGSFIRAGLLHNLNTYLRWQATDKNTTLVTRKLTDLADVVENADILVNDLEAARWKPEKIIVEVYLTAVELAAWKANPRGLVRYSSTGRGWVEEMVTKRSDKRTEFTLLKKNE